MGPWFFKIFLCYGLVAEFDQVDCLGNSRLGAVEEKTAGLFGPNVHLEAGNLQGEEQFLRPDARSRYEYLKTGNELLGGDKKAYFMKRADGGGSWVHGGRNIRNRIVSRDVSEEDYREDEVDQFGDGSDDDDDATSTLPNTPKSLRYFYRNNEKMRVSRGRQDDGRYRGADEALSADVDAGHYLERFYMNEDALESKSKEGPIFNGSMTWANTMRSNRGWSLKTA